MRRVLLGAALLLAACTHLPFTGPQPAPPAEEGEWGRARVRFTRSGKLYDGLATNAFASAVYQPLEVREARVRRVATWRALPDAERDALLAEERAEAERYDDFLVVLFTPDRPDNDLDARTSIWRLALRVPGEGEEEPLRIESVKIDATLRALYPNIGTFDVVYRVRFARWSSPIAGRPFTLRMAGSKGLLDLDFSPAAASAAR